MLRSGTTTNHNIDDMSRETSQKKALAIMMMILMGSFEMVMANIAKGGPNARKVQPKNSMTVILMPLKLNALKVTVKLIRFSFMCFIVDANE